MMALSQCSGDAVESECPSRREQPGKIAQIASSSERTVHWLRSIAKREVTISGFCAHSISGGKSDGASDSQSALSVGAWIDSCWPRAIFAIDA